MSYLIVFSRLRRRYAPRDDSIYDFLRRHQVSSLTAGELARDAVIPGFGISWTWFA
jgi:hypothetical protein